MTTEAVKLMRRTCLAAAAALTLILGAHGVLADSEPENFPAQVIQQLEQQGYDTITLTRTLLGRAQIIASTGNSRREIILNPRTGEILRDYSQGVTRTEIVAAPVVVTNPLIPPLPEAVAVVPPPAVALVPDLLPGPMAPDQPAAEKVQPDLTPEAGPVETPQESVNGWQGPSVASPDPGSPASAPEAGSEAGSDTGTVTGAVTNSDSSTGAGASTGTETRTDTDTRTDTETEPTETGE